MKRMVTLLLSILLAFTLSLPALAGSLDSEIATATSFYRQKASCKATHPAICSWRSL